MFSGKFQGAIIGINEPFKTSEGLGTLLTLITNSVLFQYPDQSDLLREKTIFNKY